MKPKLLARVRRPKGQLKAIERAHEAEAACHEVPNLVASVRGTPRSSAGSSPAPGQRQVTGIETFDLIDTRPGILRQIEDVHFALRE